MIDCLSFVLFEGLNSSFDVGESLFEIASDF